MAQGVDQQHPHLLLGPLQLGDVPVVDRSPGHGVDDLDPAGHILFPRRVEALHKAGQDAFVLLAEPPACVVGKLRVAGPQGLYQGVPDPVVGEQFRVGVVSIHNCGIMAAALGGQRLHQGGHHRVGGIGQGFAPDPLRQGLQIPGDRHRPLGAKHRVAKGDGLQQRPGPVGAVGGQDGTGKLPQLGEDGGGLFQRRQPLQGPAETEVLRRQGGPGDGSCPEPFPQFIQRRQIHFHNPPF